jgi:ABC-type amino acid transport system permease subunit
MFTGFDFAILWANAPFLWNGMLLTLQLTALAVTGGLLLGVVLAVLRLSSINRWPGRWRATSTSCARCR